MPRKKIEEKKQSIWGALWEEYKVEWKALWEQYKTLIIPFIEGTAKYIWQLIYGLIALVIKGLYETGVYYVKKLIEIIKKA
jgi:hypothetical protein